MRERFSHRSRDSVIRPIGVLLTYECLFEATHGPVQIACGAPALTGRHLTESRDLSSSGLGSVVHPSESNLSARKLKRTCRACPACSNTATSELARAEFVSDQIMTRAQGEVGDSRVLEGTRVRGRTTRLC